MTKKLKVGDLEEKEQQELCRKMQLAGCKGIFTAYSVEAALKKIEEFEQKQKEAEKANEEKEENIDKTAENDSTSLKNTENEEKKENTNENVENDSANLKNAKNEKKENKVQQKPKLCHICRQPVINGKCSGCGFVLR